MKHYLLIVSLLWVSAVAGYSQQATTGKRPVDYVNQFTGTSNSRWMLFPGPAMPFGMVKLSPDNQGLEWNGGYEYSIHSISGFSHIHSWAMGGLSLMPTTGRVKTYPGPAGGPFGTAWTAGYRSRIDKATEQAEVGYYRVALYDYDITTELTSTDRCGYLRLTYPKTEAANLLFDFDFIYEENAAKMRGAYYRLVSDSVVEGYIKQTSSFADEYTVHFVARFSQPMTQARGWERKNTAPGFLYGTAWQDSVAWYTQNEKTLQGHCGLALRFDTRQGNPVEVQTAISLVSIEQAHRNLQAEMGPMGWDFDAVVAHQQDTWNKLLSRIKVTDRSEKRKSQFYTNLYRAYVARTRWNDVDGQYVDMCEQVQQLQEPTKNIYGSDALWGAHWNLFPLWTLLTPEVANDWVNSLLEMYDKGGWLPQGPSGIEYCEVMTAAHQIKLIVSAYQKGIRNFDVDKAYEAITKHQTTPGKYHECGGWVGNKNLESYLKYGYVANEDGPVSNTMEIAFDDWAVAQMAKALGKRKDYKTFMERSENYKNVFDPKTGFFRQKHANGEWVQDWDSLENHGTWYGAGYVEGTAWHYSFFVPHDYKGLIGLVGKERLSRRLESGFEKGFVDIGNQPNMQAPFVFNYIGKPWLTQKYVNQLLGEDFNSHPYGGWPGEEDQGQLGAWFVLASMGLFQIDGGCATEPFYTFSRPLYDRLEIQLDSKYYSGNTLVIETENNAPDNMYIQSVKFNGKPLKSPWIYHKDLIQGGTLKYVLGPKPNKTWGTDMQELKY